MWTRAQARALDLILIVLLIASWTLFAFGVLYVLLALVISAHAMDDGTRYNNVDPATRAWFKAQRSPTGTLCCDIADGHRTTWRSANGGYEVPIGNQWVPVPPAAVILNSGNPVGEAVVWYIITGDHPYIRCFVPGTGS